MHMHAKSNKKTQVTDRLLYDLCVITSDNK